VLMTLAVGFPDHAVCKCKVLTYYLTYYGTHLVGQPWTPMDLSPPLTSTDAHQGTGVDRPDEIGNRVWGNSPWVQIPPSPPGSGRSRAVNWPGYINPRVTMPNCGSQTWEPNSVRSRYMLYTVGPVLLLRNVRGDHPGPALIANGAKDPEAAGLVA